MYYGILFGLIIPSLVVLSIIGLFNLANYLMSEDYENESDN